MLAKKEKQSFFLFLPVSCLFFTEKREKTDIKTSPTTFTP